MLLKPFRYIALFLLLIIVPAHSIGQVHWESLVIDSDSFSYLVPGTQPSGDWIQLTYNDAGWSKGKGGFGYGDNDDNTVLATGTSSVCLRKILNIPASVPFSDLVLDIDFDDAFVAYINGFEIARSQNLLPGTPGIEGSVTGEHEAQMYAGTLPDRFILDSRVLQDGNNILAVQIMNIDKSSSDLTSRIFLSAKLDYPTVIFHKPPVWFREVIRIDSSNLPIIKINTEGKTIIDESKIMAQMKLINNPGGINNFSDTVYEYNNYIGIEIRGNTSQMFPKKSYTIETRLSTGENNNVSLLGMPEENDWVLYGPYSDKSLMRNSLAYHIGNGMGRQWHPGTRYVEMELNGEYRGIYLLTEKIKIDKNRVNIAKLLPGDTSGNELTGGYIISIDRDQPGSWNSPFIGRTGSVDVPFSYVDPKYDELSIEQRNYIRKYITDFEYALNGNNYLDPELGYRPYIDIISFIDYFIITELSKDLDGYRVSVYFHKDKDSKGGRLTMSPFWDYNICFGNANFFDAGNTAGWASDGIGAGDWYEIPFWWDKFRTDPYFETLLKLRWQELRQDVISKPSIDQFIDSLSNLLSGAQARNFQSFKILNSYVWPNNYIGGTYGNEVEYLRNWVDNRLDWIDTRMAVIVPLDLHAPSVSTSFALDVTKYTSTIGGNIISDGGSYILEKGLYWGIETDPVQFGKKVKLGMGDGSYSHQLTGLLPGTEYYFSAYAENDLGRSFGGIYSFTTENDPSVGAEAYILEDYCISAYPNPFTENVTFEFNLASESHVKILLTNINGVIVSTQSADCQAGPNKFIFNKNDFPAGTNMFFYNILLENKSVIRGKIIRQ